MERKLYRSQNNRILLGVCGGIGEYFNIDPVIIRVIAVLLIIPGVFPVIIAYFVLALVIPLKGSTAHTPQESIQENVSDIKETTANLGEEIRTTFGAKEKEAKTADEHPLVSSSSGSHTASRGLYLLGLIIIAIGVFFILVNIFGWFWHYFWPILLIIVGVIIIVLVARRK